MGINKTGFRIRLENEIKQRRDFHEIFLKVCSKYGTQEIELPIIIPLDDYVGPPPKPLPQSHLNRVFHGITFDDTSATLGAVRYEGTTPLATYVANLDFNTPTIGFHYFQEMVRLEDFSELDDRHQRSFFQIGIEQFSKTYQDHLHTLAETIEMGMEFFDAAGIKPKVRLSHIDLVKAIFYSEEINPLTRRQLIPLLENGSIPKLQEAMIKGGFSQKLITRFIELAEQRDVPIETGLAYLEKLGLKKACSEMEYMANHLKKRADFNESVRFDSGIHRSLNFYSGITLQMDAGNVREAAGGGDYSGLMQEIGKKSDIYAAGLAAGFERLLISRIDPYAKAV